MRQDSCDWVDIIMCGFLAHYKFVKHKIVTGVHINNSESWTLLFIPAQTNIFTTATTNLIQLQNKLQLQKKKKEKRKLA